MTEIREALFQVLADLALAAQGSGTYPESHPKVQALLVRLFERVREQAQRLKGLNIGFFADHIVVDEQPFIGLNATLSRLGRLVQDKGIEKVLIRPEITFGELKRFVQFLADPGASAGGQRWEAVSYGKIENVAGARGHVAGLAAPVPQSAILAGATEVLRDVLMTLSVEGGSRVRLDDGRDIVSSIMSGLRDEGMLIDRLMRLRTHDDYTVTHSLNVCVLVVALAGRIGLPENRIREIGLAALLHDIGKEMVQTGILNKPGRLETAEFEHIKTHPVAGARILRRLDCGSDLPMIVAFEHHVKHDRSGYPRTRSASPAHPASLMTQLADVYDALRSYRPYQKSVEIERTLSIMAQGRGTEFDPLLFDAFMEVVGAGQA
jgi:putative nucleotidyltransferase with HDIG domain